MFAALYDGGDNRVFTLEYDKKVSEPEQTVAIQTDKHAASGKRSKKTGVNDGDEADTSNQARQEADTGETTADNASGTGNNANNNKKGSKRDAFLYGVLMEAAGFLPIATPVKQWIQEHVDFYVTCAIVKESIDNRDEQKTAYLYTDLKTVDYEKGYTAFDAVNDVISRQTGTGLDEADYQKISYVNDINRSNEEVLYETVAGGNRANGSFAYRYGIQRESYSYEAAATTAGSRAFDSLSISQSGSYYYDGYGSVSNLSAGEDSISYTYDAYGNMQKTGTYGEISTDSSAYGSPYGYNGEYSHALTGLQYLRARYYQASTGSFISKDSYAGNIRNILSANRYTYGENNPLGYADPSGHSVFSKIKSAVNTVVTGVKQSASKAWNRVKENASQIKNTVVNTVKTVGTALKNVNSERKSGETTSQWKNRVAQEKAAKSGAKADLISPDGLANMAKVGVAAINPITSLSTCASGLLLSGIDEFRNSYRDYMFRKVDGAIGNSAYGEQYYKAKAFVYELEKKACAAYEACQNLPQTLIKLALPKSAPDRILHGVDLIKNGKFKARGGILLGIAGVLFAGTGIGAAGVVAGLYTAGGGISQIAEGVQEVYYGIKGDTDTEVENVYSKYIYDDYYGCYDGSLEISASCGYSAFVEGLLGGAGLKNAGSGSESGSTTVIYGSDDIANYQYNMIENPGPLAEMPNQPAKNFYGGRYNMEVLQEDRIMYRAGNAQNPYGRWFTSEPPASVANVRIDTAVKTHWIDPKTGAYEASSYIDNVYAIKVPKGTTIYTGPVGPQGGVYVGGYNVMQTYIDAPWTFEVVGKTPLQ